MVWSSSSNRMHAFLFDPSKQTVSFVCHNVCSQVLLFAPEWQRWAVITRVDNFTWINWYLVYDNVRDGTEVVLTGAVIYDFSRPHIINSSPSNAAYMRQWIGSALVQTMVCRLFGVKPLSNQNTILFIQKSAYENIVCEMTAILSPGGDELKRGSDVSNCNTLIISCSEFTMISCTNMLTLTAKLLVVNSINH